MLRAGLIGLLALVSLSAGQREQTFAGTISDDMCATGTHAAMRMGPTDAECTVACVMAHGAAYVLVSGRSIYKLSDQRTPEKLAGQKVRVVGTLDAKTNVITVQSIVADRS
jgi:hypothetical protein